MSAEPLLPPDLLTPDEPLTPLEREAIVDWALTQDDPTTAAEDLADADAHDVQLPDDVRPTPPWRIDGTGSAEWAMAHLAGIDANLAALKEQRDAYLDRIKTWHADAARRLIVSRAFFAHHLEEYARELRLADDKATTLRLPSGKVTTTRHRPKVEVADEAAVIAWADENLSVAEAEAVIKTEQSVLVSELRKLAEPGTTTTGLWAMDLSCGCSVAIKPIDPKDAPTVGRTYDCPTCHDLEWPSTVIAAGWEQTVAAVTPTGKIVPGTVVVPEHVTGKATPG